MKSPGSKLIRLKKMVSAERQGKSRPHYSDAVKSEVRRLVAEGIGLAALVAAVDISYNTLRIWSQDEPQNAKPKKFRSVKVSSPTTIELVFPSGVKVTGFSFEQILQVATHASAA